MNDTKALQKLSDNRIPYRFTPREYQVEFLRQVEASIMGKSPIRYFLQVWHRRAGKDKTNIAYTVPRRLVHDPCLVKFVYPTLVMGRENLWDGIGGDGMRYMDHIPPFIRDGRANETTMKVPIIHGSLFQIGGSDKPDSLRGGNPRMMVFSEWSEQDPYAWDVTEPILRENDGIAIFNMTPKGNNHARGMYEYAKNNPRWFVQLLTANDTKIWTPQELEAILQDIIKRFSAQGRSEGEAVAYYEQEYMCSFNSPVIGAYYGDNIRKAEEAGRITRVPHIDTHPVDTYWDLGMDDSMTIWFVQSVGLEHRFIDYVENSGEGLAYYAKVLQNKGYLYGRHFAPHDIAVRELGTGKSRLETARTLGIKFETVEKLSIDDGINAVRSVFSQCWFDADKCHRGINCLKNYTKDWDEKNKIFRSYPKHNWASHGADAMRVFGVGHKKKVVIVPQTDFGGVKPFIEGTLA